MSSSFLPQIKIRISTIIECWMDPRTFGRTSLLVTKKRNARSLLRNHNRISSKVLINLFGKEALVPIGGNLLLEALVGFKNYKLAF